MTEVLDKADVWAAALVSRLLEEGHLELVTRASKPDVIALVAHVLGFDRFRGEHLAARLIDCRGVAELNCDDDTLAALASACEPAQADVVAARAKAQAERPAAPPAPPPRPSKLDAAMTALLERAVARAWAEGQAEVLLSNVLVEMLAQDAMVAVAKRRGGDPDRARDGALARLRRARGKTVEPTRSRLLERALANAEEEAPRFASMGDVALSAMKLEDGGEESALFRMAFEPPPPPPPVPEDDDAPDELADRATPEGARGPGVLTLSAELHEALRIVHDRAARHARPWALAPSRTGNLSAQLVLDCEAELGTTLPDDFWGAAAAGLQELVELFVVPATFDATPALEGDLTEAILSAAADAEADIDEGFVAILAIENEPEPTYLCVRRGVAYADRQGQSVYRIDASETVDLGPFGAHLLRVAQGEYGAPKPRSPAFSYRARLHGPPASKR